MTRLFGALLIVAFTGSAWADPATPPAPREAEKQALETFATAHKECREWSDGCMICVRHDAEKFGCSLPGVACQPTALACRDPAPPDPEKTPPDAPKK